MHGIVAVVNSYDYIRQRITCSAGEHRWFAYETENAAKCCNGFVPVKVPWEYRFELSDWIATVSSSLNLVRISWVTLLVPDTDEQLISRLKVKVPIWIWESNRVAPPQDKQH